MLAAAYLVQIPGLVGGVTSFLYLEAFSNFSIKANLKLSLFCLEYRTEAQQTIESEI